MSVYSKDNNEIFIKFSFNGENSIEGTATVVRSNNNDVGSVYKLKGMKVE